MTAPLDPDQETAARFRAQAKAQIIAGWNKLESKVGQKGLWLILAIVCMLVVMKVCF